jgi:HD-GYP domain-containing protein (c-di-GMP phosphodiesterase class II)
MLSNTIEARDRNTRGHVERVQRYALALARALHWDDEALAVLEFGALLHDMGKILVPRAILNKPGHLSPAEWEVLRRHPEEGAHMLAGVDHLRAAMPYVLHHHEHWNGSGYPHGLAGTAIPVEGRLLAVVDAFDAMTSERPYRPARPRAEACEEIVRLAGRQFDPAIAAAFVNLPLLDR